MERKRRGNRRWEEFVLLRDESSGLFDNTEDEEEFRRLNCYFKRRDSEASHSLWRSVLRFFLGVLKWVFLFWYFGPKIFTRYIRKRAVEKSLERGSVNIPDAGILGPNQTSHSLGFYNNRYRFHLRTMERAITANFEDQINRECSDDTDLMELPSGSEIILLKDVACKEIVNNEKELEGPELPDFVIQESTVVSKETNSVELPDLRCIDRIEQNPLHSELDVAEISTLIPSAFGPNSTGDLLTSVVSTNESIEGQEESGIDEPSEIMESDNEVFFQVLKSSATDGKNEGVRKRVDTVNEFRSSIEKHFPVDFQKVQNQAEAHNTIIAPESSPSPNNFESSLNQDPLVSGEAKIEDHSTTLIPPSSIAPSVPVDPESRESSFLSSALDEDVENINSLERSTGSLENKRRKISKFTPLRTDKQLTVLEEAMLIFQGRTSTEIAQMDTASFNPLSRSYAMRSEEAASSLTQTHPSRVVAPPYSNFWSDKGRRKKKLKWINGQLVAQSSRGSSPASSLRSTGTASDDSQLAVKRKLNY